MFKTTCPSCGAPVSFRSAASVMAVCAYCNSTLLKDAESVKDLGKMGQVLEDYSRIQIPASGQIDGGRFTVVGRIQLRYDAGFWNEWYVMFDDGSTGWLSDGSGQYIFTRAITGNPRVPGFAQFHPGKVLVHEGKSFYASDIRTAHCTAGEGELPFKVGAGYEARVVDLRCGNDFMTLDYADDKYPPPPRVVSPLDPSKLVDMVDPQQYLGRAVTLEEMQCQLLRDDDAIKEKSGNFRGRMQALDCPTCGSSIPYVPGMATQMVCPSCHNGVDASGAKAEAILSMQVLEKHEPTLPLGASDKLDGVDWQVLGAMAVSSDEGEVWGEYLLFNTRAGFLWLVELDDGKWEKSSVLNGWPERWVNSAARVNGANYQMMYRYTATVQYVIGAFNWRVAVGDKQVNADYANGPQHLSMERTEQEITWSVSTPLSEAEFSAAFGQHARKGWLQAFSRRSGPAHVTATPGFVPADDRPDTVPNASVLPAPDLAPIAKLFTGILFFANLAYLGSGLGIVVFIVAAIMLWAPLLSSGEAGS
jgi:uncharacterized Zn finger protein (UPF0148 family)